MPGYKTISTDENVQRCIYKVADLVSNMTIMLMENGENGDIRIKNGLSQKIDIYPNSNMVRKNFIHKIVTEMCNSGNCVLYPYISPDNGIEDLLFLKNCSFSSVGNSYLINSGGKSYKPDEVVHFVLNPDKDYPYKGRGFAPLLKDTIKNLSQANATKTSFLQSKWKPSLIISVNSDSEELMNKEQRKKILDNYTETTEIGEPWLIPAGEIDVKTVQPLTLNDLAIQDSITLDLKTVACAIGICPFMVGIGEFNKDAYNNCIATTVMSIATIIQQTLTKSLLYSPKMYFKFNPKSLMQYSLAEQTAFVKDLAGMGMLNKNEGRSEFDYSPVDVEGMNDYTVLENYLKVSDLDKQKKLLQKMEGGE